MASTSVKSPWRLARTAAAATLSTATAIAVHLSTGGIVTPLTATVLIVVAAGIAWPLTSRRVSTSQLLGLLVLCQGLVHAVASAGDPTVGGLPMLAAHGVATVMTLLVLVRAERWAWQLARVLRSLRSVRLLERPIPVVAIPKLNSVAPTADVRRCTPSVFRGSIGVRGPPVWAA